MAKWTIDPTHSEIGFKVKHLMISTVSGSFASFDGAAQGASDQFENVTLSFNAQINSISTGVAQRDEHLKSDDFFNAEKFPELKFVSSGFSATEPGEYNLLGDLTIRDVTRQVKLTATYNGTMTDPYGNTKSGFEISGSINRKDFNLMWSFTTEAGGVVVSDEVKLYCNIQLVKSVD